MIFVIVERYRAAPMVNLRLFRIPTFTPTLLAALFQGLANFAVLFLVLMYLQGVRRLTPLDASLLLVPGYLVGGVIGPICGRPRTGSARSGRRRSASASKSSRSVVYSQLTPMTPLAVVTLAAVLNGIGAGAFMPANNSAVMKVAPGRDFGIASGMLRTFANIGMVFSFSARGSRGRALGLPPTGLRHLRRHDEPAPQVGTGVHDGSSRRVLLLDRIHGARRRVLREPGVRRWEEARPRTRAKRRLRPASKSPLTTPGPTDAAIWAADR